MRRSYSGHDRKGRRRVVKRNDVSIVGRTIIVLQIMSQ